MKKIQVSTVRQMADVEVMYINANLISRVINANNVMKGIVEQALNTGGIEPVYKLDDEGETVPVLDEKTGEQVVHYHTMYLSSSQICDIAKVAAPLLQALVDAFLGEE